MKYPRRYQFKSNTAYQKALRLWKKENRERIRKAEREQLYPVLK